MVPKQCPLLWSTFWYLICCATCFGSRYNSKYHTYPLNQPPTNLHDRDRIFIDCSTPASRLRRSGHNYTFSHCKSASVQLRSADCIGVVSWDTTPTKVASYRHSAPLRQRGIENRRSASRWHWSQNLGYWMSMPKLNAPAEIHCRRSNMNTRDLILMKSVEVLKDCRSLNAAAEMNCPMPRSVEKVPVRNEKRCTYIT